MLRVQELLNSFYQLVLANKAGCNDDAISQLLKENPELVNTKSSALKLLLNQWDAKECSLEDFKKTALLLIELGADASVGDSHFGHTFLHHLVLANKEGCNDEVIKLLLKANPGLVNSPNSWGHSALKVLSAQWKSGLSVEDFQKTAALLVENGADPSLVDSQNSLALLHQLVLANHGGCNDGALKLLLKANPDLVNKTNIRENGTFDVLLNQWKSQGLSLEDFKKTALLLAEHGVECILPYSYLERLVLLNNKGDFNSEISMLMSLDRKAINQTNNFNINKYNINTVLQVFIRTIPNASVEQVKFLVAQGASLTERTPSGRSLLHLASIHGNQLLAEYLVAQGLKFDDLSASGYTLFHVSNHKNEQYWNWLLSNNTDLDAQNNYGQTALHYAVYSEDIVLVKWLIKNKASLSIANEEGETPLQRANRLLGCHSEISACLLAAGAELRDNSHKRQLFTSLKTMKNYGESLGFEAKGKIVSTLAEQLEKKAKELFKGKLTAEKLEAFKKDFIPLLHSKDQTMSEYRTSWERIIANVLIALTGLGALLIAAHLAYTKATTGRALLFFQPPKTNSERLVAEVDHSLKVLSV